MPVPIPILAEVNDKMMSFPTLVAWNVALIMLALVFAKKKRWLALLPCSFAFFLALGTFEELCDPFVGPAVIHELGFGYVTLSFLPLLAIMAVVVSAKRTA
jgi:hypothetical protein